MGDLSVFDLSTGADVHLGISGVNPKFSTDGCKIVFQSSGIWVMNSDGSSVRQLTDHGMWAAWSPDGTQIAFSSDRDGDFDIWLMNADGTNARRILSRPGQDIDVVWSPGARILFGGLEDRRNAHEIFAFDPVASTLTRLTTSARQDFEPSGSPADGSFPRLVIAGGRQPSWGP